MKLRNAICVERPVYKKSPSLERIEYDWFRWVLKATNHDDTTSFRSCVRVFEQGDIKYVEATDGHRLHRAETTVLNPGVYRQIAGTTSVESAVFLTEEQNVEYPNTKKFIERRKNIKKEWQNVKHENLGDPKYTFLSVFHKRCEGVTNSHYVLDLFSQGVRGDWFFAPEESGPTGERPIHFKYEGDYKAVAALMPIKA